VSFEAGHSWQTKPLGELCEVLDRLRKPITKRDRAPGRYPYYGATGILDYVEGYLFDEPLVLIGEDGAKWEAGANSAFGISGKSWVNNHAHVVRPKRDELLDKWLIYYLNAADLLPFVSGLTVPKLNQGMLREIPIPVPPLEEQRRIVAVLDEAFEGLARASENAEANLQSAGELFELERDRLLSPSHSMRRQTTIGEVCVGFEYGTSAKSKPEGSVAVLRMGNIQDGEIDYGDLVYSDEARDIAKLSLTNGDVLFNRTNSAEHVGKTAIYRGDVPAIFAGYLIRLHRDPDQVEAEYLNLFLNSRTARNHGRTVMGRSVNQANISASKLRDYPIALPTLVEQRKIAAQLLELRAGAGELRERAVAKISRVAELRQSLLQKAFAGELT
jgi:type I restriction enzyme S subunit